MEKLEYLDNISYQKEGLNDKDGFQIFTPEYIVNGMIKMIGEKEFLDFDKTILEPTSGDGAFTCRILELRLKSIKKDKSDIDSLKALSTIYSIEMDQELLDKQKNKIYTIMINYAKKNKITSDLYFKAIEDIIETNFYWAMTNVDFPSDGFFCEVAYKMPEAKSKKYEPIEFYSYKFNDDLTFDKKLEEVELW